MEQRSLQIGDINGCNVGFILKEIVTRAIFKIREHRYTDVVESKGVTADGKNDVYTPGDTEAQRLYVQYLKENFPRVAIIAEEDGLRYIPEGWDGRTYFTVDPVDGTKAFTRRQSHGIGTMIGMVQDEEVIAAYIGDVNTLEVYGYRPGSSKVHRINLSERDQHVVLNYERPLDFDRNGNNYVLLRDPLERTLPDTVAGWTRDTFGSQVVDGGSIGIWLARLWKREVAAAIVRGSVETPWDSVPVIGITKKLGYRYFTHRGDGVLWQPYEPLIAPESYTREDPMLIVHEEDIQVLHLV
jgi:fructose-1,6-bisphosphatase/inositol monophosphatase family enzyme